MRPREKPLVAVLIALLALVVLAGCGSESQPPKITLTSEAPERAPPPATNPTAPVRIAVAPIMSPRESFRLYGPMMDYLAEKLGRPVEFLLRPTYTEVNELLRTGQADVAFVCDYAYVLGKRGFGMEILAVPQIMGQQTYRSYLIVPPGSEARSLEDLRGKRFAFSDPLSSSGWLYPTYLLNLRGEHPATFFARTVFTYSHDNTLWLVADRFVDAGAVDSLVYDFMALREPRLRQLQIIARSPAWGNPPVVVHPRIDPSLRDRLRQIFLAMDRDPKAKRFLAELMIDRFVLLDDTHYDEVWDMAARVKGHR